jgi:hypothetical protein
MSIPQTVAIFVLFASACSQAVYPEKMTYANPSPGRAERFVHKYFGFHKRNFDFERSAAACAHITWLQLCQSEEVRTVDSDELNWNWEWGVHFVDTKKQPQGPMSIRTWKAFVHSQVGKMQVTKPAVAVPCILDARCHWMQAHSVTVTVTVTDRNRNRRAGTSGCRRTPPTSPAA